MKDCESGIKITTVPYCVSSVDPRGTFDGACRISYGPAAVHAIPTALSEKVIAVFQPFFQLTQAT